jgi:Xaa-Pro aminopeptidase
MLLPSAPRGYRSGDSELPYRPDSELFYLTGWREPEALLLLRGFADEAREILWVADRDPAAERWTGVRKGPEGARRALDFPDVRPLSRMVDELPGLLAGADRLHLRPGRGPDAGAELRTLVLRAAFEVLATARARGAKTGTGPRGLVDPGGILDELRLRKDLEEISLLRAAAQASVAGFEAAFDRVRRGVTHEYQVEGALLGAFREAGAAGPAYAPIVAAGRNACILHYGANDAPVVEGDLLLVDAGAELGLYAGDITRTFPASGRYSEAQREICRIVDEARAAGVNAVRPGATIEEVHRAASVVLALGLVELGILGGDPEEALERGELAPWYPHRTSHWLGLDTHDPGDYVVEGSPRVLEPGMVLTVEPGLYFPPAGLFGDGDAPDPDPAARWRGIGVRIEDDVLVTDDGFENLTGALPSGPEALEERLGG